jgi:U6 snRNA-associated Sm-like protein LSm4
MPECYIRGSTIKYLRIPDEVIDMVKEEVVAKGRGRGDNKGPRGGQRGGRGGVFQRGGKIATNLFTEKYSDTYLRISGFNQRGGPRGGGGPNRGGPRPQRK